MNNIKTLREQHKMTQQDCANIFGVTLRAWQTYEQGVSEPKFSVLFKIADYYNVTLDYLLGRAEQKNPLLEMQVKPINDDEMWEAYDRLPDIAKEIFVEVMEVLSKASRKKESKKAEEKPPIQVKQGQKQNWAIARTSDPQKQYIPAPTDEMMELFTPLTPEDLGEK